MFTCISVLLCKRTSAWTSAAISNEYLVFSSLSDQRYCSLLTSVVEESRCFYLDVYFNCLCGECRLYRDMERQIVLTLLYLLPKESYHKKLTSDEKSLRHICNLDIVIPVSKTSTWFERQY